MQLKPFKEKRKLTKTMKNLDLKIIVGNWREEGYASLNDKGEKKNMLGLGRGLDFSSLS